MYTSVCLRETERRERKKWSAKREREREMEERAREVERENEWVLERDEKNQGKEKISTICKRFFIPHFLFSFK